MPKIQRYYEAAVRPAGVDTSDVGVSDDGFYEPITLSLWYEPSRAPEPMSPKAIAEVTKRAIKLERKSHDTPDDRSFEVEVRSFLRERVI